MITSELNKKPPAPHSPNEEDEGRMAHAGTPAFAPMGARRCTDAPPDSQYDFGGDTEADTDDEDEDEPKPNSSTSTMNDEQSVGKTLTHEEYEEITKRNSEQSPLLRLPAELRNQIYQYALSGYVIQPYSSFSSNKLERRIHCQPAPGSMTTWPEDNLWPLVQSLSHSSRQLHAEIGEMVFTESIICYFSKDTWINVGCLSEKRKAAIEKVQMRAPGWWVNLSIELGRSFEELDLLPNVKTLYVRSDLPELEPGVEEKITCEAHRRGLEVIFQHGLFK